MLNFFKKFMKKDINLYTVQNTIYKDKKILCYSDLYTKVGIMNDIESMIKENKFKKYHYSNIQASYKTIIKLDSLIRNNLKTTKNKWSRIYTTNILETMAAMDTLQWAPKINEELKEDEILVILPNNKKFINVTEEML